MAYRTGGVPLPCSGRSRISGYVFLKEINDPANTGRPVSLAGVDVFRPWRQPDAASWLSEAWCGEPSRMQKLSGFRASL